MNSFKKDNKQVNSINDAAGPQLPTNAVSVMQHSFNSNHLLGPLKLALILI